MVAKGIILAGGAGTRLLPLTKTVGKQLLPVFDKPMVYYPLAALMAAGIRDVLVISTPRDLPAFRSLFGNGARLGIRLGYATQARPRGIAEAFVIGARFVGGDPVALALGDNLFLGRGVQSALAAIGRHREGALIFAKAVADGGPYGVVRLGRDGRPSAIVEKPREKGAAQAVPGLYAFGPDVARLARDLSPSARGELEITDLVQAYLERGRLRVHRLGKDVDWFDMGRPQTLLDAGVAVAQAQTAKRMVGSPEAIAFAQGWIGRTALREAARRHPGSAYGQFLESLARR